MNLPPSRLPLLAGAGFIVVLSLQVAQIYNSSMLAKRMDALEQGHKALQDSFLDGSRGSRAKLAASLGYRAVPPPMAPRDGNGPSGRDGDAPPSPAPAQVFSDMQRVIAAEPKDAAWAGNVQLNVRDVVESLSQEGLSIPATPTVECRSQHCLIGFELGEGNNTDEWIQQFITEIAPDLPQASYMLVPSPDGHATSLQVLANRNTGASASPSGHCPPGIAGCS